MNKKLKTLVRRINNWMNFSPPGAMSATGWRLFEEEFKEVAPIRYWFKHTFHRGFVWPVQRAYKNCRSWIGYRTTHRYHVMKTGLNPGYQDKDTIMLYINFNILKDFVEIELGSRYSDQTFTWCELHIPFYRLFYPYRRPDLGMKSLEWACTLDDPSLPPNERSEEQAKASREIRELYIWWVVERPSRKPVKRLRFSDQGKGNIGSFDDEFDREAEDYKAYIKSLDDSRKQEENWRNEDQAMLERLIKIRQSLWS
jgi:hypothetical protein